MVLLALRLGRAAGWQVTLLVGMASAVVLLVLRLGWCQGLGCME